MKQVNKELYNFIYFCSQDRWGSYWQQLYEIVNLRPESVLEIGIRDKVIGSYIINNLEIKYLSMDIADDLKPDIIGSIDNIPLNKDAFDLVCAFEVLEHLPFEKFSVSLKELYRVSKKYVIISLPHWGRHFSIDIRLPFIKRLKLQVKIDPFPIKHKFNDQHYWEIGKKEFSLKKIKNKINSAGFIIIKDYIVFGSPYHHFFILKK